MEEWRTIPSHPAYEVSSNGRVRRAKPYRSTTVGRVLSPSLDRRKGYLVVRLGIGGGKLRGAGVHRLVCEAFHGPAPSPKHVAAHNDGNPSNNAPENIRWATHRENMADRVRHGTDPTGARNPNARLADEDVLLIRSHLMFGEHPNVLSRLFGVTDAHIASIARRKTWKHLEF